MSGHTPSLSEIPAYPFSFNINKDLKAPNIDPDLHLPPHTSPITSPQTYRSIAASSGVLNNTYIKLQDALNNGLKSGKNNLNSFSQKNLIPNRNYKHTPTISTQILRNPSPRTTNYTHREPTSSRATPFQGRASLASTPVRGNPSSIAFDGSTYNTFLNFSRGENSVNKPSPIRGFNKSLDNGKYSTIHKRDGSLSNVKLADVEYRSPITLFSSRDNRDGVITERNQPKTERSREKRPTAAFSNNLLTSLTNGRKEDNGFVKEAKLKLEAAACCQKHDSSCMLYQVATKRLLCVECIFNSSQANLPRQGLLSLKNATPLINECTKKMVQEAKRQIGRLEETVQICNKNATLAQNVYEGLVDLLNKEFDELIDVIQKKREILKNSLNSMMEETKTEMIEKAYNYEFLKKALEESRDLYSSQNFESSLQFFTTFNTIKDIMKTYNSHPALLSKDDFNVLELRGQKKLKAELELFGKVIKKTAKSCERPKSMPRSVRNSDPLYSDKKGENNNDSLEFLNNRNGSKSAEKQERHERLSDIFNTPKTPRDNLYESSLKQEFNTNLSTIRSPCSPTKPNTINFGNLTTERLDSPIAPSSTRESQHINRPNKRNNFIENESVKQVLNTLFAKKGFSTDKGSIEKNRRNKLISIDVIEGESKGAHTERPRSTNEGQNRNRINKRVEQERENGLFEEIESLECLTMSKAEADEDISDNVYKEVESMLATIKRKEILFFDGMDNRSSLFFQDSSILTNKNKVGELMDMLPPGLKETRLIYKLTQDGAGSEAFHEKCDDQGPCLVVAKVNESYVFGYFMPVSFAKNERYESCEDCFIFSLQNPSYPTALKFPTKDSKKFFAIFQSVTSPCLGSTLQNKQDLFIQLDDLKSSCSVIGYAYRLPNGVDGTKALAGSYTDWDFDEIEVFALSF